MVHPLQQYRRKRPPAVADATNESFVEGRTTRSAASRVGKYERQRMTEKSYNASEADEEKPRAMKRRIRPDRPSRVCKKQPKPS